MSLNDVTRFLSAIEQGESGATDRLLPIVYDELRRLASHRLAAGLSSRDFLRSVIGLSRSRSPDGARFMAPAFAYNAANALTVWCEFGRRDRIQDENGVTIMVDMKREDRGDTGVVFVAQNIHSPSCGRPPEIRKDADLGLYHGYFENRFGEQFVFTFDGATEAGTISGGDLGWDEPKAFTLDLLAEALCSTLELAAKIEPGSLEAAGIPIVDAALALGRLTGLTGKDEVIWLRACLAACAPGWGILKERRSE